MKVDLKRFAKTIKSINGNSLAEFATVTALMSILAATASSKLSGLGENARAEKTMAELDKLVRQAANFYQDTAISEGRGRFPGQDKYNEKIGGHADNQAILDDIEHVYDASGNITDPADFTSFIDDDAYDWVSVFGVSNLDFPKPDGATLRWVDEDETDPCNTCPEVATVGKVEWLILFGGSPLGSPYQDGHYVYQVVAGSGSGTRAQAPTLYVADIENAKDFHVIFQP